MTGHKKPPKRMGAVRELPEIDSVHVEAADIVQLDNVTTLIPDPDAILSELDQQNLKKWAAIIAGVVLLISQVIQLVA